MSRIKIFQHADPNVFYGQIDDATVMDHKNNFRIVQGHPSGPVLEYYALKAIISKQDETALRNIGIK
ncbi:hypothetical protein [Haemophilus parainfluenzae]|uniref:hypothetical protein n=1 Tax=Haemophilus parainfluenzae TaxID=729 RepID=UPI0018A5EC60|nr:hypothetical protein [Haemophilus parainfluenzae]QOR12693.1 hypothetical protein INP97_09600 [Haemophilus parainfluenzae]